jgi:hypothetical protein
MTTATRAAVLLDDLAPGALDGRTAAILDLPRGFRDDPEGYEGLAALAARWLATGHDGAAPEERGWRTRHRLEPHVSSFSYWSGLGDLDRLAGDFRALLRPPSTAQLDNLKSAQLRLLGHRSAKLYLRMLDLLDEAALGRAEVGALGDEQSVARVSAADVAAHLAQCRKAGIVVHQADDPPTIGRTASAASGERYWRGGLRAAGTPTETRTRVAVRIPLDTGALPPGALPLLVELLGTGSQGRVVQALRGDRALAYGVAALSWDAEPVAGKGIAPPSVGAYALVAPEHTAEAARLLLDTVRAALTQPPSAELAAAARRCRTLLLVQVDQPFGPVAERRERARGGLGLARLAEAVATCADEGLSLRTAGGTRPALAVVGDVRREQLDLVEAGE